WHVIDVPEVLRESVPGIAQIVEEVRADNMPAQTPGAAIPRAGDLGAALYNLVDAADFEAGMVEAGPVGLHEGQDMMIAVAGAAQKSQDAAAGRVGKLHAKEARVEVGCAARVRCEEQHMAETPRLRTGASGRRAPAADAPDVAGRIGSAAGFL